MEVNLGYFLQLLNPIILITLNLLGGGVGGIKSFELF